MNILRKRTSVKPPAKPYHHGALRPALIDAGLTLINSRTTGDLSLREIARTVGVSANAVYRHFPNREALLGAIAAEGFDRLAEVQRDAFDENDDNREGFAASGRAYVRFAIANPALFRLMFTIPSVSPIDARRRVNSAGLLLSMHAGLVSRNGQEATANAIRAWAIAHGLAMLILDNQMEFTEQALQSVIR